MYIAKTILIMHCCQNVTANAVVINEKENASVATVTTFIFVTTFVKIDFGASLLLSSLFHKTR